MGFSDMHAHILETGSVTRKGESADARMIRYSTGYYPSDVGVEMVILDIEDFRLSAKLAEPRLAVELEELVINLDCSLASKGSEDGRRMLELQRQHDNLARMNMRVETQDNKIDSNNYIVQKDSHGNKNYN